ncbi:3-oxoacyl-ACP reductase FabG [Streptomyces sp. NPDC047071]|uniref:3-oxoacyl-ACP reductase FabG n=1 Tax=Streptomyces sp. NPDC047071 TaxID=3154808 RepID=UPI00345438A9
MPNVAPLRPPDESCSLVTGASRGIGAAIALSLAATGRPVVVGYRADEAAAQRTVEAVERAGGKALAVRADVTVSTDVERIFDSAESAFGPVTVLINNAGIRSDQVFSAMEPDDWNVVLDTNLNSVYRTVRRALPAMGKARFGRIVNIGSVLGGRSLPGVANYATAKAGLEALTRSVAVEVARRGITVNAVAPGLVETELVRDVAFLRRSARAAIPARRAARPAEIAACVSFLASPEAGYVTGTTLTVDGGLSAAAFLPGAVHD